MPSWTAYCFYTVISVLIAIPLIVSFYQAYSRGISSNKSNAFMRLASIAGFSISQIMFTIMLIISSVITINDTINVTLQCIANTLWLTSEFMLLIYFINRFYYAFLSYPRYQLSDKTYKIFYFGSSIYWIVQLATNINILSVFYNYYHPLTADWFGIFYNSISALVDTSLNLYVLYKFTQKMILLINDELSNTNIINNQQREKLLDTVTKYFVLLTFSILTSTTALMGATISCAYHIHENQQQYYLYPVPSQHLYFADYFVNYAWQIDCLSNAYCIFFEREYAKKYYHCLCISTTRIHCGARAFFVRFANKNKRNMAQQEPHGVPLLMNTIESQVHESIN